MSMKVVESLVSLYQEDETAWLEQMAQLIAERRFAELDYAHLQEFLTDRARRDKREVLSRLTTLLTHRLKWEHQPDKRSNSWRAKIAPRHPGARRWPTRRCEPRRASHPRARLAPTTNLPASAPCSASTSKKPDLKMGEFEGAKLPSRKILPTCSYL